MKITFDHLKNNAIEYFCSSLEDYNNGEYKSAVSDLWSGTLLLMKCKLFKIHPILLVSDILDCLALETTVCVSLVKLDEIANEKQFSKIDIENINSIISNSYSSFQQLCVACSISSENKKHVLYKYCLEKRTSFSFDTPDLEKDLKTVTLDEILKRFKQLKEPNEVYQKYSKHLEYIKKARNRMEHYVNDLKSEQLLPMYEYAIPFINDFLEYELDISAESEIENWKEFLDIKSIADARKETVEKYILDNQISSRDYRHGTDLRIESECSECGSKTIDVGDGYLYCKACGNKDNYNVCCECGEIFLENGYETFHEEINMCDDCLMYKAEKE